MTPKSNFNTVKNCQSNLFMRTFAHTFRRLPELAGTEKGISADERLSLGPRRKPKTPPNSSKTNKHATPNINKREALLPTVDEGQGAAPKGRERSETADDAGTQERACKRWNLGF